jgi:methyl-accepting chemotaxis protein
MNAYDFNCQTDHTQCIFGNWYYGEGRIKAELLDPKLKPLLDHLRNLTSNCMASAAEIKSTYLKHQL